MSAPLPGSRSASALADWRDQPTLTVVQVAQVLGIARNTAYTAIRNGELPVVRLGARQLVPVAALRRMLGELASDQQEAF